MKPNASATWVGDLRRGKGVVTTGSGTLSRSQYVGTGDGGGTGANPYELIAAAHAACFSMTLANELAGAGFTPQRIATTVTVTLEPLPAGWTLTSVQLDVLAEVPRLMQNDFIKAAVGAKTRCTISRLLKANLSMSAKLDNSDNRRAPKVRRPLDSLKVSKTKKQSIGRSSCKGRTSSREKGCEWDPLQKGRGTEDAEIKKVSFMPTPTARDHDQCGERTV
jgi:lipoyl-dependent peroxiredoxin